MSREAYLKFPSLGKAPADRDDLFRILDLAEKMMDGSRPETGGTRSQAENVIPLSAQFWRLEFAELWGALTRRRLAAGRDFWE